MLPVLGLLSCDDDAKPDPEQGGCGIVLNLVGMVSPWQPNVETKGVDMPWQESIFLWGDGTFVKHYVKEGVEENAKGTYTYVTQDEIDYVELTFNDPKSPLVEACGAEPGKVLIKIDSATRFTSGAWTPCDGPSLIYEKKVANCED